MSLSLKIINFFWQVICLSNIDVDYWLHWRYSLNAQCPLLWHFSSIILLGVQVLQLLSS
jgi:hypothetical protein